MIKGISHLGFDVKDMDAILHFYCDLLGMKKKFTLTFSQAYEKLLDDCAGTIPEELNEFAAMLKKRGTEKWLTYLEMSPHQYLEFFYQYEEKEEMPKMEKAYGYQHFSLEVEDIRAVLSNLEKNGVYPDTPLRKGVDGTWQCWLHDPEGNKFELMEYTADSLQITGNDI